MTRTDFPVKPGIFRINSAIVFFVGCLCLSFCSPRAGEDFRHARNLLPAAIAQQAELTSSSPAARKESRVLVQACGSVIRLYEELPARFRIKVLTRSSLTTRASIQIAEEHGGKISRWTPKTREDAKTFSRRAGGIFELTLTAKGPPDGSVVWEKLLVQTADDLDPPAPPPQQATLSSRPDIFLYVVDALRADHLGCYGYLRDTSPRIDRFARKNTLCLNAYAQTSWTRPSAASILSGLPPKEHHTIGRDDRLPEEIITLAERLQEGGYETVAVIANGHLHSVYGFAQGFGTFEYLGMVSSLRVHQKVESILLQRLRRKDRKPLFFLIWTIDPHDPYEPEAIDSGLFSIGDFEPLPTPEGNLLILIRDGKIKPTPSQKKYLEARYDQEIRGNDRAFGQLLDLLEAKGLADSAIVFFTADHGEEFFEHGGVGHGRTLYNEQVHVPLIIKAPFIRPGRQTARIQHIDLYPTILEIAGCKRPNGLEGISLMRMRSGPRTLYFELALDGFDLTAVLDDRKVIYSRAKNGDPSFNPAFEVFGNDDFRELQPRLAETFKDRLLQQKIFNYRHILDSAYRRAESKESNLPPEVRKHLEALGYIR